MKAATQEQCKTIEREILSGNNKEAYNTLEALNKTQQHKSAVIEDYSGNTLTENTAVLNQWTEYCSGLYNYELHPDTSLLQSNPIQESESLSVLREEEEVKVAMRSLKAGKTPERTVFPPGCLRMEARQRQQS